MSADEQEDLDLEKPDRIPRQSLWAAMPKRSFARIVMLLAALVGILYLRQKTSVIADLMGDALKVPSTTPSTLRARVATTPGDSSSP